MRMLFWVTPLVAALLSSSASWAEDTLKKIKDSGTITLGVRESSPLSYTIGDGKYVGYHIDICERIVADLRRQLGGKIDIRFQQVTSANRIPLTMNGTVDLECGSTANNRTRQKDVAFAVTTFVEEARVAVKASSGITNIDQLAGKTVVTTNGTTFLQTLRRYERAKGVDFKEVFGKDHDDSFLLLESGRADAFVTDGSILAKNIAASKKPADFRLLWEVLAVEPVALMMRKDDPAFKKAVDESIKGLIRSGELARIYDKWFLQPIPPNSTRIGLPPSAATKDAWAYPNDRPKEDYRDGENFSGTTTTCNASCRKRYCCTSSNGTAPKCQDEACK